MNGPTSAIYHCITASYSDGSGTPDVLLITDNEQLAHAYLGMIERAEPMKTIRLVTPAAVIITKSTNAQEGAE